MSEADSTDQENIRHLEACDGCSECDALLEFYSYCDGCEMPGNKIALNADGKGKLYCDVCNDKLKGRRVMPSEAKLKPCGWCNEQPVKDVYVGGEPEMVACVNMDCPMYLRPMPEGEWNTRADRATPDIDKAVDIDMIVDAFANLEVATEEEYKEEGRRILSSLQPKPSLAPAESDTVKVLEGLRGEMNDLIVSDGAISYEDKDRLIDKAIKTAEGEK